jgi:hypothetical protein
MQETTIGINDQSKGREKEQKWNDTCVKDILLFQVITELCIDCRKALLEWIETECQIRFVPRHANTLKNTYNSCWQVAIRLDEWNDFGTTSRRRYEQHVLGVSQYGVIEQDAKEHESQGK